MSRPRTAAALAVVALIAVACGESGGTPAWTGGAPPTSEPHGVTISPGVPGGGSGGENNNGGSGGGGSGPGQPPPSSGSSSSPNAEDPAVLAKHLNAPVGLSLLPDGTALVGERTTGRIVRVQPTPGRPAPVVKRLTGLDTKGDGGLLDLAVSPNYGEDRLVFALITTRTDNRVVTFTLDGPVTPVVTKIPKGTTGNTGRIAFAPNGNLYIGTGDTGRPALAADPGSLAGKILRVTDIGEAAPGNPAGDLVYSRGHHPVDGLCLVPQSTGVLDVEAGRDQIGEVNVIRAGFDYATTGPAATLPAAATQPGGCAVRDTTLFVTSLDGRRLLSAHLAGAAATLRPGKFKVALRNKYGRLRTVVVAEDGAIWLTTSNKDGEGKPVKDDERVIRILGGGIESDPT